MELQVAASSPTFVKGGISTMATIMSREVGGRVYTGTMTDPEVKGDDCEQIFRSHDAAANTITSFDADAKLIEADVNLSAQGKAAALATATAKHLAILDSVQGIADRASRQADDEQAALAPAKQHDPAAASEVRSWFRSIPRADQISTVAGLLDSNDFSTLSALLDPKFAVMKLLPTQIADHARRVMLEKQHGDALLGIERKKRISQVAQYGISRARTWVKARAGITETPQTGCGAPRAS